MFRQFTRGCFAFSQAATLQYQKEMRSLKFSRLFKLAGFASIPAMLYFSNKMLKAQSREEEPMRNIQKDSAVESKFYQNPQTGWEKFQSALANIGRFFQLILIFMPSVLAFPLRMFKLTEKLWLSLFVSAVERAGVVWIKAFQYLSHRRDVLGAEMADSFTHLRENAPQHSFQETKRNFKKCYGKQISEIFDDFTEIPIASGSVSQVYKAVYKGQKVAVKVRHPEVDKYIQRDVNILFGISRFLAIFSKSFEIPIDSKSMKKTLIDQIDFNNEKDNLNTFNRHFLGNKSIRFPSAFDEETRDSILIESFVEGLPVTYFQNNRHDLNPLIARLGATTFFEMLMKNNFIHADCHGGNILVEVTKQSATFFGEIWDYVKSKFQQGQSSLTEHFLKNQTLRKLYKQSREQEQKVYKLVRKCTEKVRITLIDVGMVIQLSQKDQLNFVNFIKSVIEGNGEKCASMIYSMSNFDGQKIIEGKYGQYKSQLRELFSVLDNSGFFQIQGMELLVGMLNIIRENNMKLDGEFATLLTNIVVLESIAKEIDPDIQILKCAIPYFKFIGKTSQAVPLRGDSLAALVV